MSEELKVNLSSDEAKLLKSIYDRDELIRKLTTSQSLLAALNKALSVWVGGPISLVLKWDDALFKGWAKANSNLGKIERMTTCNDLLGPIVDNSPNQDFFEKLRSIRGCDDN